jgi:hypothetical protein
MPGLWPGSKTIAHKKHRHIDFGSQISFFWVFAHHSFFPLLSLRTLRPLRETFVFIFFIQSAFRNWTFRNPVGGFEFGFLVQSAIRIPHSAIPKGVLNMEKTRENWGNRSIAGIHHLLIKKHTPTSSILFSFYLSMTYRLCFYDPRWHVFR